MFDPCQYFDSNCFPFLARQVEEFSGSHLSQIKIAHNTPLMLSALIKLQPFLRNNINLAVSTPEFLGHDPRSINYLKDREIFFSFDKDSLDDCDIHLDCSANLKGIGSPKAVAELTQSGAKKYHEASLSIPVVSIDQSRIKLLEDYLGTGEGFVRALQEKYHISMANKHVLIFGYGKVGKGIGRSVKESGGKVTAVDSVDEAAVFAEKKSIEFISVDDFKSLKRVISSADIIVTSTGIKDFVSTSVFSSAVGRCDAVLANMGAEDEFGPMFSDGKVLNNKLAVNFSLFEPTLLKYLDPVFYAHNLCLKLYVEGRLRPGFQPLPKCIDDQILSEWEEIWQEDISDIRSLESP